MESTTTDATRDDAEGQAPVATTTTTTRETERVSDPGSVDALPKWAQSMIGDLRKENADRRKREQATEDQRKRDEEAAAVKQGEWQTVAEKAQAERDVERQKREEVERATRERLIRAEIRSVATEMQFANPTVAHRLIDLAAVQTDDAGEPQNVKALLDALAKDEPYLVKQAGGGAFIPPTARGATPQTHDQAVAERVKELRASGRYIA